jgi:hypothetical protein
MPWSKKAPFAPEGKKIEPRPAVFANKPPKAAAPAWIARPVEEPRPGAHESARKRFTLPPAPRPSERPRAPSIVPVVAAPIAPAPAPQPEPAPPTRPSAEEEERLAALRQALADIGSLREVIFSQTERQLVELAVTIARQVIAREVATDPSVLVELAREGIKALDERDKIVVRFGAALDDGLREAFTEALRKDAPRCEVVIDPSLGPRECIVETELGRVDESIESRLYHVLEALVP